MQNVFRSLRCFLYKSIYPHIDVCSNKCSPRLVPNVSCVRSQIALRTPTCPERRQVRCCRTHRHFAKLCFRRCWSKRMVPDRKTQHLYNFTVFCPPLFVFLFYQKKKFDNPPQTTTVILLSLLEGGRYFCAFIVLLYVSMIWLSNFVLFVKLGLLEACNIATHLYSRLGTYFNNENICRLSRCLTGTTTTATSCNPLRLHATSNVDDDRVIPSSTKYHFPTATFTRTFCVG